MSEKKDIKEIVKEKYGQIAIQAEGQNKTSCCGTSKTVEYSTFSPDYSKVDGYAADADLNLGFRYRSGRIIA